MLFYIGRRKFINIAVRPAYITYTTETGYRTSPKENVVTI